ncbi:MULTISPECIES: DUF3696 domain-containing protein [Methylobacterium]|uniref:AAA family ATPase n=1 Tax=Methylobacterium TaxID=407 RepID=UPI0005C16A9A|nr:MULTISPECIES: DUF3696 domain-containing protein [Methylobacterium]SFF23365.1 Predicted ATPase [Methylobacterium sp. 13MFTsu3.1M2]
MLDRLHLKNFKCFDELTLPTKPITLLTGFNAAGKSTALQSALLLAQHLRPHRSRPLLALNGDLVELGTPGDVLNERAGRERRTMAVGAGSGRADALWHLGADDRKSGAALTVERVEFVGATTGPESRDPADTLDDLPGAYGAIVADLRDLIYLSAVRTGTADTFPARETVDHVQADVGVRGEYAPWWFEQLIDEPVEVGRRHPDEPAATLRRQFDAWAATLFPGAEANALRLPRTSLVRLELRTRTTSEYRRPANIGYGLTYAFPILVALLLARDGQTVVVDSPEAHLHPRGQSAMGYLLACFAQAGVQILVETHSDHVLNGVRLAVRDGRVSREDAAVHFFVPGEDPEGGSTRVVSPGFGADGSLGEWPEGFFDQADRDLARLAGWD